MYLRSIQEQALLQSEDKVIQMTQELLQNARVVVENKFMDHKEVLARRSDIGMSSSSVKRPEGSAQDDGPFDGVDASLEFKGTVVEGHVELINAIDYLAAARLRRRQPTTDQPRMVSKSNIPSYLVMIAQPL